MMPVTVTPPGEGLGYHSSNVVSIYLGGLQGPLCLLHGRFKAKGPACGSTC